MRESTRNHAGARSVRAITKDPALVRDRREQLIRAAQEVFQAKGFHKATVRDIGRAAGLTQGTIYNYVRSKDDILYLVCDHVVTEYVASVQQASVATGNPRTRLDVALRGIARVMIERRSSILLLYHESHNLDRRALRSLLARVGEFIAQVEGLVADALGAKPRSNAELNLLANIVTFLPTMAALRGWALPQHVARERYVDVLIDFMMRGLGCAAAEATRAVGNSRAELSRPVPARHRSERNSRGAIDGLRARGARTANAGTE